MPVESGGLAPAKEARGDEAASHLRPAAPDRDLASASKDGVAQASDRVCWESVFADRFAASPPNRFQKHHEQTVKRVRASDRDSQKREAPAARQVGPGIARRNAAQAMAPGPIARVVALPGRSCERARPSGRERLMDAPSSQATAADSGALRLKSGQFVQSLASWRSPRRPCSVTSRLCKRQRIPRDPLVKLEADGGPG
jgi:hypothetical protein